MGGAIWLIVIGLFIWFLNLGYLSFWKWSRDWPLILVGIGVYLLLSGAGGKLKELFRVVKVKKKKKKTKEILEKIDKGEISVDDAVEKLKEAD